MKQNSHLRSVCNGLPSPVSVTVNVETLSGPTLYGYPLST